jgi:ubiquinone/menaquinone biosynthesis C-methylase UbiE
MAKKISKMHFRMMAAGFAIRDFFDHREEFLEEASLGHGFHVLDFGCGTGSYSIPAATTVGESGKVYALDNQPLSIRTVEKKASKKGIRNIETILSDCDTGLPDASIDVALFFDTFHLLSNPDEVLKEIHRVLKPNGLLSFSDHHLKEKVIISSIEKDGLFRLSMQGKKTYSFIKE